MTEQHGAILGREALAGLVHHLLVEKKANMLDKTKCSVSARNIYNYICGDEVACNDNLADCLPNLRELGAALCAGDGAFYVHFEHLTNETSHYFIICRSGDVAMLLQSAVFEFSIFEWLHPELARQVYPGQEGELDARDRAALEQRRSDHRRHAAVLDNIEACRYNSGRPIPVDALVAEFIPKLVSLEGAWTLDDCADRCRVFKELFACELNADIIRSHIKMGAKPAAVKFITSAFNRGRVPLK